MLMLKKFFLILFLTHTLYALEKQDIEIPTFGWDFTLNIKMQRQADSKEVFETKTHTLESLINILLFDGPRDGHIHFNIVSWQLLRLENDDLIQTDIEILKKYALQCKATNRECLLHKGRYLAKIFQHTSLTCDNQYLDSKSLDSHNEKYNSLYENLYEFVDYILYDIPYRSTKCGITDDIKECHYVPTMTNIVQFYAFKTKEKCFNK